MWFIDCSCMCVCVCVCVRVGGGWRVCVKVEMVEWSALRKELLQIKEASTWYSSQVHPVIYTIYEL